MIGQLEIFNADGKARTGRFYTAHGAFDTPAFMPVGTQATVKGVSPRELLELGAQIVLSNTYHLHLRPGDELIKKLGGLHKFMGWDGPILTDSGGFQVYSLAKLRKVTDEGVKFQSHVDGAEVFFTPEKVIQIQENLGVDIMMVLDECVAWDESEKTNQDKFKQALDRTHLWGKLSQAARELSTSLAFGIIQGGFSKELRTEAVQRTVECGFDGYAIGGLSVGEPPEIMRELVAHTAPLMPEDKPRYVMGVGYPHDLLDCIGEGVDMFDCVIPTRSARFGRILTKTGFFNIKNQVYREDSRPLEEGCGCYTCQNFSRAYLSHLIHAKEALMVQLASIHNLWLYQDLLKGARAAIKAGSFTEYRKPIVENWLDALSSKN